MLTASASDGGGTFTAWKRRSSERSFSIDLRNSAGVVAPPSEAEAVSIFDGVRERYESFHQVRYTDDALHAAVYQSHRYIPDRFLPDKAIDVIDEAGARVKLRVRREQGNLADWNEINEWSRSYGDNSSLRVQHEDALVSAEVTRDDVEDVIARWTGIPVNSLKEEETQKLLRIEIELHKRVISQRPAISALARAIRRSRAGLKNPLRRLVHSCSLVRPVSAKLKWPARWRSFSSAANARSLGLICRSSWRSIQSRS